MRLKSSKRLIWTGLMALICWNTGVAYGQTAVSSFAPRCRSLFLGETDSYQKFENLGIFNQEQRLGRPLPESVDLSFATSVPLVRSFEKEGLYYEEIAEWFPKVRPSAKTKLQARFDLERETETPKLLNQWIDSITPELPSLAGKMWQALKTEDKLKFLLREENPFKILSVKDRSSLFANDILNFNDIAPGEKAPPLVTVGDDLGSYEVRLSRGVVDRVQFHQLRDQVELFLEGKIGHQHLFHSWPGDLGLRKEIAPYYIELLDSSTWYLYWRQIKRNPEEVESIMTHPFLGVYTRRSLDRLNKALVKDQPEKFRDKYRMIGARNFPPSAAVPEQGEGLVPDWELRSGNKGEKREFVESMLIARLSTGDYSGLRDYQSYNFNPSAPIRELLAPWLRKGLTEEDIVTVENFEKTHAQMRWSAHGKANNHTRNRIVSPLLPWQNRLSLDFKKEQLSEAQQEFAVGLVKVARTFLNEISSSQKTSRQSQQEAIQQLEILSYQFAQKARLDLDFERYLSPRPAQFPAITIAVNSGPVDINSLPLGIEYSFRMPFEMKPETKAQADEQIRGFAESFAAIEGKKPIEKTGAEGHGHGIAVKYKVTDRFEQAWRFEWDGIQRNYDEAGKVLNAWGGHIEVVTPKFSPESIEGSIGDLFAQSRERGLQPRRSAGGAHVNFDLGGLMKNFPAREGTRRLINLISYFESNEPLILFLWQHPMRVHAAYPVHVGEVAARKLFEFEGDWKQLGRLLYEIRYFNSYVGRKPKYVPLNLTALMTPIIPDNYIERTLDIRNPKKDWFPNFNKVYDRGEARFFDAPINEKMAALQIKYFRALLDKGLNSKEKILLVRRFNDYDVSLWQENVDYWIQSVNAHLIELGLNPEEFRGLIWDSWLNRSEHEPSQKALQRFENFEPAKAD